MEKDQPGIAIKMVIRPMTVESVVKAVQERRCRESRDELINIFSKLHKVPRVRALGHDTGPCPGIRKDPLPSRQERARGLRYVDTEVPFHRRLLHVLLHGPSQWSLRCHCSGREIIAP